MSSYLLDTSALLAHYFAERGGDEVNELWQDADNRVFTCVLSLPEFRTRLQAIQVEPHEITEIVELYFDHLTQPLPVDRRVAQAASEIRDSASARLPLVDALIAACAKEHDAILVHRDLHMTTIDSPTLRQLALPDQD